MGDQLPQWLVDTISTLPRDQQGVALGFAAAGYVAGRSALVAEPQGAPQPPTFEAGSAVQAERADVAVYVDPHPGDLRAGFQAAAP